MSKQPIERALFVLVVGILLALIASNFRSRHRRIVRQQAQAAVDVMVSAAEEGDFRRVKSLLDRGVAADAPDQSGRTALLAAVESSTPPTLRLVKLLLKRGAKVDGIHPLPARTPLMVACMRGNAALARLLISNGANLNAPGLPDPYRPGGETPLIYAVQRGGPTVVSVLLDAGADVSIGEYRRENPLMYAIQAHNLECVRLLLRRRTVIARGRSGIGESEASRGPGGDGDTKPYPHPVDINAGDHTGETALMFAIDDNCLDIARVLMAHGADVNAHQRNGRTALQMAIYRGFTDDVRLLIEHHADVKSPGDFRGTPIQTAEAVHRADLVAMLRAAGAEK